MTEEPINENFPFCCYNLKDLWYEGSFNPKDNKLYTTDEMNSETKIFYIEYCPFCSKKLPPVSTDTNG